MKPKRFELKITTNKKIPPTVTSGPLDMELQKDKINDSFGPKEVENLHKSAPLNRNIQNVINGTVKSDVLFENANSQSSKPNGQSDCCGNVYKVDQKLDLVVDVERNFYKRSFSEMLNIYFHDNTLNCMQDLNFLKNSYKKTIDLIKQYCTV